MKQLFETDLYPGKPKILFIGFANSTHTHAWIDLLSNAEFNVRLFAMPGSLPPYDSQVKTYVCVRDIKTNTPMRQYLYSGIKGRMKRSYDKNFKKVCMRSAGEPDAWLADIIKQWKPDIIHTFGMFDGQGGLFYYETREKYNLQGIGKWILQTRGGSDLTLRRHDPEFAPTIQKMFHASYQIISDNTVNIHYAQQLGIASEKFASIVPVPGTGGVEITEFSENPLPPSQRERIILWPKAYESQWSKALPVLEAIELAWPQIQPCKIYMTVATAETKAWLCTLPEAIRENCVVAERIPRDELLALMKRARVLLIPSLVDGVPNSLYEAMVYGTFPIVSPLETIVPIVNNEENVLFARNLYPTEISAVLIRAMLEDTLVDRAAQNNFRLVRRIASRSIIAGKVINYYQALVG
jgi:hypothetical protein